MNLANKFTIARVVMIPLFMVAILVDAIPYNYTFAAAVFIIASVTDTIDGILARKKNMITDFGKFLDPLADKALVVTALICLVDLGWTPGVIVAVIVIREFTVNALRLVASSGGEVIAASIWGKLKTVTQMVAVVSTLVFMAFLQIVPDLISENVLYIISLVMMIIAAVMTVISGADYIYKYKDFIDTEK